jgi:MSHA biogenesis protein MshI
MLLPFFNKKKSKKGLIGVDFQPDRIALAHIMHAEQPGAKPRLKQCAFKDIDSQSQTESGGLSSVLHKTAQSFPVNQFECNSSVSGGQYELLLVDAPNVESSELKQAVRWRIKDQLSYHIDDAVIDVFEIPGQQSTRAKLMYVVTSQRQDLDQQVSLFKQAGMSIQSIDIYELAQRNIAAIMPEDKDGVVTLRMNKSDGLLTITRNGVLYLTRKIDFGCQRLEQVMNASSDDGVELSLDELDPVDEQSEHEALNELDSTSESLAEFSEPAQLSEQSRLIIDEVVLEIQRSLDYYVSHFNQRAVSKIIIAPLVREVPGVLEYISDMLGIKTEIIDFNKYLDVAKPLSNEMQSRCFDAIGLALRQDVAQG